MLPIFINVHRKASCLLADAPHLFFLEHNCSQVYSTFLLLLPSVRRVKTIWLSRGRSFSFFISLYPKFTKTAASISLRLLPLRRSTLKSPFRDFQRVNGRLKIGDERARKVFKNRRVAETSRGPPPWTFISRILPSFPTLTYLCRVKISTLNVRHAAIYL